MVKKIHIKLFVEISLFGFSFGLEKCFFNNIRVNFAVLYSLTLFLSNLVYGNIVWRYMSRHLCHWYLSPINPKKFFFCLLVYGHISKYFFSIFPHSSHLRLTAMRRNIHLSSFFLQSHKDFVLIFEKSVDRWPNSKIIINK